MLKRLFNIFTDAAPVFDIPKDVLDEHDELMRFTPDLAFLQRQEAHVLFVYNELMRGGWNHRHLLLPGLAKSVMLGPGITENTYTVFQKTRGKAPFPIALKTKVGVPHLDFGEIGAFTFGQPAQVGGQIFGIYPEMFPAIDKYMLNGIYFKRRRLTVLCPTRVKADRCIQLPGGRILASGDWYVTPVRAWAYEGRPEFWDKYLSAYAFTTVALKKKSRENQHRGHFQITDKYYYFDPTIFKA